MQHAALPPRTMQSGAVSARCVLDELTQTPLPAALSTRVTSAVPGLQTPGTSLTVVDHVWGLPQALLSHWSRGQDPARQRMCSLRSFFDELAAPKALIEVFFSSHEIRCRAPTAIPVGSAPVMGIVRLPLQVDCPFAHSKPRHAMSSTSQVSSTFDMDSFKSRRATP